MRPFQYQTFVCHKPKRKFHKEHYNSNLNCLHIHLLCDRKGIVSSFFQSYYLAKDPVACCIVFILPWQRLLCEDSDS